MATRIVEGKKPYTGGKAIEIDENKVISLRLRDENNLIIYDEGDNEIYVDLQLDDEIRPTDAFPVGVTTGRVIVDNGWDLAGTIICAKTTSGDNIKLLYADEGTLWIDNGTGSFKQIYLKDEIDDLLQAIQDQIDDLAEEKQDKLGSISVTLESADWINQEQTVTATGVTASNTVICSSAPSSITDYSDNGVYCSAQGTDSLTFSCDITPTTDITVNVVIID